MNDPVLGNNLYTSIAWQSDSPTQAAKLAYQLGLPKHVIKAIRNAAKYKRDAGEEAFRERYSPWENVEINVTRIVNIRFKAFYNGEEGKRPLNEREYEQLKKRLTKAAAELHIDLIW